MIDLITFIILTLFERESTECDTPVLSGPDLDQITVTIFARAISTSIILLYTLIFFLLFSIWIKDAVSVDIARVDIARIDIALISFSRAAKDGDNLLIFCLLLYNLIFFFYFPFGSDAGCQSRARPTFFPTFDKSHCDKRHSSSTNGLSVYVEKQPVAFKECCMKYWCEKAK